MPPRTACAPVSGDQKMAPRSKACEQPPPLSPQISAASGRPSTVSAPDAAQRLPMPVLVEKFRNCVPVQTSTLPLENFCRDLPPMTVSSVTGYPNVGSAPAACHCGPVRPEAVKTGWAPVDEVQ